MWKDVNRYSWAMLITFTLTIIGITLSNLNMLEGYSLLDRFFATSILLCMLSLILSILHTNALGNITRSSPWTCGFLVPIGFFAFITNLEALLLSLPTRDITTLAFSCLITGLIGSCTSGLLFTHIVISYRSFKEVIKPELQM